MTAIDETALESLSLVCNLSRNVHVKSKPASEPEDETEYARYFPQFMWVIRDFSLQLVDDQDQDINPKQYLEDALRTIPASSSTISSPHYQ